MNTDSVVCTGMGDGYRHYSRFSFDDRVYHRSSKEAGTVMGIVLRPNSQPVYEVCFDGEREESICTEFELCDKIPVE